MTQAARDAAAAPGVKALVVRLSSIGDVVHTLPVLAALRRAGWEAGWVVEPAAYPLLAGQSLAQLVKAPPRRDWTLREAWTRMGELRAARYDVALDMAGLWKSAAWARFAGAGRTVGFAKAWRREPSSRWLVGDTVEVPASAVHVIDQNLALLGALGIDAVGLREFPLPEAQAESVRVDAWLRERGVAGPFAILNPGGGWPNKLWPPERYGQLALALRERGIACVATWGPGEGLLADRIVNFAGDAVVRAFPTTLLELLALIRRASLLVAADTGPLHIACAAGTPVVGVYGPTDPARNGPFAPADRVVRREVPCFPCYKRFCPRHDGFMSTLETEEVLAAVDARLAPAMSPADPR